MLQRNYMTSHELYEEYIGNYPIEQKSLVRALDECKWVLAERRHSRILDAGCGTGFFTRQLAELGAPCKILAVDRSVELLSGAASNLKALTNVRLLRGDLLELAFGCGFDLITVTSVYHHIPDSRKVEFTRRLASWLADGGHIIFFEKFVARCRPLKSYRRAYRAYYRELMKDSRRQGVPDLVIEQMQECVRLGVSREDEFKVTYDTFARHLSRAGLRIVRSTRTWPADSRFRDAKVGNFVVVTRRVCT